MKNNNQRMLLAATEGLIERLGEMRTELNNDMSADKDNGLNQSTLEAADEAISIFIDCRNALVEEWDAGIDKGELNWIPDDD